MLVGSNTTFLPPNTLAQLGLTKPSRQHETGGGTMTYPERGDEDRVITNAARHPWNHRAKEAGAEAFHGALRHPVASTKPDAAVGVSVLGMGLEVMRHALRLLDIASQQHPKRRRPDLSVAELKELFRSDFEVRELELAREMQNQAIPPQSRRFQAQRYRRHH